MIDAARVLAMVSHPTEGDNFSGAKARGCPDEGEGRLGLCCAHREEILG